MVTVATIYPDTNPTGWTERSFALVVNVDELQVIREALEAYAFEAEQYADHETAAEWRRIRTTAEMVGNWGDASYWGGRLSDAADLVELVRLVVANV